MTNLIDVFGKNLEDERKNKKISASELEKIAGVSRNMIRQYERGLALPTLSTAFQIANALGTTVNDLCKEKSPLN